MLTNEEMQRIGSSTFTLKNNYQGMTMLLDSASAFVQGYTPVFIDCIDDYNQNFYYPNNPPFDNVSGYTLAQIEQCLDAGSFMAVKNKLKNSYVNPTSQYLDTLFGYYKNIDFPSVR